MLIHLNNFPRQFSNIEGELFRLKCLYTEAVSSSYLIFQLQSFFKIHREWLTALSLFPFMVSLSNCGLSRYGRNVFSNTCYMFFTTDFFALLQSCCFTFNVNFRLICYIHITDIPALNRDEKITCESCGTQTTKRSFVQHRTRCSAGSLTCHSCFNVSTKLRAKMIYHFAKKNFIATARDLIKSNFLTKTFAAFTFCGNISWGKMEYTEVPELKALVLHNYWEVLMTIAWKKN